MLFYGVLRKFQHYIVFKSETNANVPIKANLDGTCLGGPLTNVCFLCWSKIQDNGHHITRQILHRILIEHGPYLRI